MTGSVPDIARCGQCAHFCADPATLEREFPGLAIMGSGWGSTRAGDGLCRRHDLYLPGSGSCAEFRAAEP